MRELAEKFVNTMIENSRKRIEAMRGKGICLRCHNIWDEEEIIKEFQIINPRTKETKFSVLCKNAG
jgi:hypothetical protein